MKYLVLILSVATSHNLNAQQNDKAIPRQPDITALSPAEFVGDEVTPLERAQSDIRLLTFIVIRQGKQIDSLLAAVKELRKTAKPEQEKKPINHPTNWAKGLQIEEAKRQKRREIPKAEYESWLEEHRRSQDGPFIGNGG